RGPAAPQADTIGPRMDPFADTEDQASLRKLARDLAERELAPRASHWDETEEFPYHSWDVLKASELLGITTGEEHGGMGMGDVESTIVLEERARADVSSAILCQLVFNAPPRAIDHLGNDDRNPPCRPPWPSGDAWF